MIDRRIGLLFAGFLALLITAVARASYLDVFQGSHLRQWEQTHAVATVTSPAPRGEILDRNGTVLALSVNADQIDVDPQRVSDPDRYAPRIARILDIPEPTILARLTANTTYSPIANDVPAAEATKVADLGVNSLWLTQQEKRIYPLGSTASQVLGFVGSDGQGLGGLELSLNSDLNGRAGVSRVAYDGAGQPVSVQQLHTEEAGKSVRLTIDAPIQSYVEQVLGTVGAQYSPEAATAIVMNPRDGDILALANWPFVSPENLRAIAAAPDYAVQYQYEPGSTFKAITVAGALQEGLVTPNTVIPVPPDLHIGTYTISDAESHGYEQDTVAQILKVSSNIGADEIANRGTAQQFNSWVHAFGFGTQTGIPLDAEAPGDIPALSNYTQSTMYTMPFGQGLSVTPIQMATAYSAIADNGVLHRPRLIESIGGAPAPVAKPRRVVSVQTASELRNMLRGVLADGGTASGAQIYGYDLAGKTGTAQVAVDGKYSASKFVASFIGMVPASAPKLVVAVVVFEPQGSIYGGSVAAPAFQKIVGWTVPYLRINPCPAPCPASAYSTPVASTP